jgi:exopolysaccharide biosynthesis WecB/TagA/CpsF family protein
MVFTAKRIVVGGIKIEVLTRRQWAKNIVDHCQARAGRRPKMIFAANGQVVALFASDPGFRAGFERADAVTADGQPLVWASRLTRHPLPERAATTDLFHDVACAAENLGLTFFLLGATERNNAIAEAQIRSKYPALRIVGRQDGYFDPASEQDIVDRIGALKPDVLWIGLGAKKQVEFVIANIASLSNVGCVITCGGLFDYFTPEIKRAPIWMQNLSVEWLFRTWQEPQKYFWRYAITNPAAMFLLLTRTRSI